MLDHDKIDRIIELLKQRFPEEYEYIKTDPYKNLLSEYPCEEWGIDIFLKEFVNLYLLSKGYGFIRDEYNKNGNYIYSRDKNNQKICFDENGAYKTLNKIKINDKQFMIEFINRIDNEFTKTDTDTTLHLFFERLTILNYASDVLRDDQDVVLAALAKNTLDLQFVSQRLREDESIIHCALNTYWENNDGHNRGIRILEYVAGKILFNEEIIISALNCYPENIDYVNDDLINNKDFVINLLSHKCSTSYLYKLICKRTNKYIDDKDVVLLAAKNGDAYYVITNCSERLKKDFDVIYAILENDNEWTDTEFASIYHISREVRIEIANKIKNKLST